MSESESEFLEKLKKAKAIKCNRFNIMDGELLYHILAIYDDEAVAVRYYGKHKQWWHYEFYNVIELKIYFENCWIELRGNP
jgi:hypothetical protein